MKWSEQMRELISVDENFNQLELDATKKILTLNGEFLINTSTPYGNGTHVVEYSDYKRIIKKYPFFTDKKFLLGCIFKINRNGGYPEFSNTSVIEEYDNKIEIQATGTDEEAAIAGIEKVMKDSKLI